MGPHRPAFTHYLITRFNVPVADWSADKDGVATRDEAWMAHRLGVFADFCVPTVRQQSVRDFTWIICLDAATPEATTDAIRRLVDEIPRVEFLPAVSHDAMMQRLRERLAADPADVIVTSRLDNDDGLGPDFIKIVQSHVDVADKQLVNLLGGLLYDVPNRVLTRLRLSRFNHFTSLVERNLHDGRLLTVIGFPHTRPPADVTVVDVPARYGWLKIVHARNVSSRTKGLPLFGYPRDAGFVVDKRLLPVSVVATVKYTLQRMLTVLWQRLRIHGQS
jgi:hypothetical protein